MIQLSPAESWSAFVTIVCAFILAVWIYSDYKQDSARRARRPRIRLMEQPRTTDVHELGRFWR